MTVRAAGEPVPALKYQLLPPVSEQIRGDSMTLYYTLMDHVGQIRQEHKDFQDMADRWNDASAEDLLKDKDKIVATLKKFDEVWPMLDLATRQMTCTWNLEEDKMGANTELPSLSLWRYLARFVALQARMAIAEGHYDDAIHSLQMGYGMARDAARGPTVIQDLVGIAMAALCNRQVETMMAAKNGPNLYWAIANLPRPMFNLGRQFAFEANVLYWTVPELRDAKAGQLTPQQWQELPDLIARRFRPISKQMEATSKIYEGVAPSTVLPQAREYWHSRGLSDKQIDAMPVNEANIVFSLDMHDRLMADVIKWYNVPYWQAQPGLERTQRQVEEATKNGQAGLFGDFLPNLVKPRALQANLYQQMAALQTIEAIRLHAAAHGGRLPASLADVTDFPAPVSPVTGKLLEYKAEGNTFEISVRAAGEGENVRYILTITK